MDSLVAHLQVELRLLWDHASLLAYLLRSNHDRQASVSIALATLYSNGPVDAFPVPPVQAYSAQPTTSGDIEPLDFSDSEL